MALCRGRQTKMLHIANAAIIPRVNAVVRRHGYEPPLIYTPQELMEESNDA
jgi:hypothetical protein